MATRELLELDRWSFALRASEERLSELEAK